MKHIHSCHQCKNEFANESKNGKFCSHKCYSVFRGKFYRGTSHPNWKGGKKNEMVCKTCKTIFLGALYRQYCSNKCQVSTFIGMFGEKSATWKGGKYLDKNGYVLIYRPKHMNATNNGYIREHRFNMSEKLGRPLLAGEVVHHINEVKNDNRLENLVVLTKKEHDAISRSNRTQKIKITRLALNTRLLPLQ